MSASPRLTVGLVGARGHTGAELVRLIAGHPLFELGFVSSRELAGQRVADHHDAVNGDLRYQPSVPDVVAEAGMQAYVLAMPNGKLLSADPALKLSIEGHTDNTGAAAHNQELSTARARSVLGALVGLGVAAFELAATPNPSTSSGQAASRYASLVLS